MAKRALLVGLALLALLFAAAPFVELELPDLTRDVLERSREQTGVAIDAARSRFRLLEGLTLEDVSARARSGVAGYDVRLDRIRFEHRPLSLLAGRFEIRRVVLERPRIDLAVSGAGDEEETPSSSSTGGGSGARGKVESDVAHAGREDAPPAEGRRETRIAVSTPIEVGIRGGSFRGLRLRRAFASAAGFGEPAEATSEGASASLAEARRAEAGERLVVEGLDLTLTDASYDRGALTPLHALDSRGAASIARVAFEKLRIEGVEADFRARGGRFELEPLRFQASGGNFAGKLALDFNVLPFRYRLALAGDAVEIAPLGAGRLRFDAEGFGSESRNLTGAGTLEIGPGTLPDVPLVRAIDASLAGAGYEAAFGQFEVRRDVVHVDELRFEADSFGLALSGSIAVDGPIDLDLTLTRGNRRSFYSSKGTLQAPEVTRRAW